MIKSDHVLYWEVACVVFNLNNLMRPAEIMRETGQCLLSDINIFQDWDKYIFKWVPFCFLFIFYVEFRECKVQPWASYDPASDNFLTNPIITFFSTSLNYRQIRGKCKEVTSRSQAETECFQVPVQTGRMTSATCTNRVCGAQFFVSSNCCF